ncbi:hypothetical protein AU381_02625 [Sinorhizobium glycinis]|uniref:Uncharacterized protein n=1 Tax=Sinorhizobium glycinis TaxID=1472378 RepID=A0A178XZS7_9HYPH|nr:hypothetical protein AU381_02625 [Sinorhizobium glycinis]
MPLLPACGEKVAGRPDEGQILAAHHIQTPGILLGFRAFKALRPGLKAQNRKERFSKDLSGTG